MLETDPSQPDCLLLMVKVVPGSSRDAIAGILGTRLKIKVAAAPEKGQANASVIRLIAKALGLPASQVAVIRGPTSPEKTLRIRGITLPDALQRLNL
jgi:uncharacterized protein (TIGR00251 family)